MSEQEEFEFRARAEAEQNDQGIKKPGLIKRGWDALNVPEQMARQGLDQIAQFIPQPEPTGNKVMDLLKGAPHIAAETMAEAAPPFVSRASILGSVGAKALQFAPEIGQGLGAAGRGLATQLESASGIAPKGEGALVAAYKDPSIIFGRGTGAVSKMYKGILRTLQPQNAERLNQMVEEEQAALQAKKLEAARNYLTGKTPQLEAVSQPSAVGEIKSLDNELNPRRLIVKAEKLADKGQLTPDRALDARKEIDPLIKKGKIVKTKGLAMREKFDKVAKEAFSAADTAYQRAIKSEALRNFLPQNKYGGASPFKAMILKMTGGLAAPLLSPAVQGAGAALMGMADRGIVTPIVKNPTMMSLISASLRRMRGGQ